MGPPVEPPPSAWAFPRPAVAGRDDVVVAGADLEPGTVLAAYRRGIFPMPDQGMLLWWSPPHRGVIDLASFAPARSLRRAVRDFEIRIDTSFDQVIRACADRSRPGGWIDSSMMAAYQRLHALGWAHSVEAWVDDELAGGLYGVAIGGLFAGESMFHRRTNASKVALVGLIEMLTADGHPDRLLDVQWLTDHLESLGATEIPREAYLDRLAHALAVPLPAAFAD